ncbi:class I histocompatibility antigen, F10 alpha chain-like isoform X1 [Anser cygnoides]|uniref:class I histocompatibility antigen, F10 alpha chain-like isoform X1 n=1 Tax=Anser cygnoides TaxID=8845 RepID=UPI0034D23D78
MGPGRAGGLRLLLLLLLLLLGVLGGAARGPHSLHYFYTAVSDPGPGLPQFVIVGYVDGEAFVRYDSETQRMEPRVDWMAANEGQQYWDRQSEIAQNDEQNYRVDLDTLRERYIQSRGSHTLQYMCGCDLLEDGSIRGFEQHGYDGKDFLAFDKDTLTYTAADAGAQITKRKWEEEGIVAGRRKHYLENTCIEGLKKYVSYGKAMLERRGRPEVRVSGMEADRILTLSCRAHGFYPRPISISWLKDGVVQEQETQRGSTVPNSDGTYHAWATIEVLPGDRDKYQCRVEHASLPQPGLFSWEPQSNLIPIVAGVAVAVVAVIAALAGFAVWKSKQGKKEKGYNVALGSDWRSSSWTIGTEQVWGFREEPQRGSNPSVYLLCFSP